MVEVEVTVGAMVEMMAMEVVVLERQVSTTDYFPLHIIRTQCISSNMPNLFHISCSCT